MDPDVPPGAWDLRARARQDLLHLRRGAPLSFGSLSDFTFYADRDAYDYVRWADWAAAHGMNHVRAYLPRSFRYVERFVAENGGDPDAVAVTYEETVPGSRTFDLTEFDDDYWDRFHEQVGYLASRDIVVPLS